MGLINSKINQLVKLSDTKNNMMKKGPKKSTKNSIHRQSL